MGAGLHVNIDVSTLDGTNLTGIGNYIRYLIQGLKAIPGIDIAGSFRLSRFRKQDVIRQHVPGIPLHPYFPVISDMLPSKARVFHGPDFRIPASRTMKKVVTIHDMAHLEPLAFPEAIRAKMHERMDRNIIGHRPDFIIAISEFTKNEVLKIYPQFRDRITSIHLGADHVTRPDSTRRPFDFPFVLFVGSLERRKNIDGVLNAFGRLEGPLAELRLVIAGGQGTSREWSDQIETRIKTSPVANRIHYLRYADRTTLLQLYCNAQCLVFPSHYEGFGIPILEAMTLGCPVITSDIGSMREIAGSAALLVNPRDTESIADSIRQVASKPRLRDELISKGQQHARKFTWMTCATETAKIYRGVA